jgi:hypothetical protein
MNIELRNIQIFDKMSEETTAFHASLYIDNKKIGWAKNGGTGGCTDYGADDHKDYVLLKQADDYCKRTMAESQSLEEVIDNLLEEYLVEQDGKKMKKRMLTHIMFGNSSQYTEVHWPKITIAQLLLIPLGREKIKAAIRSLRKKAKDGDALLNTNIKEELL